MLTTVEKLKKMKKDLKREGDKLEENGAAASPKAEEIDAMLKVARIKSVLPDKSSDIRAIQIKNAITEGAMNGDSMGKIKNKLEAREFIEPEIMKGIDGYISGFFDFFISHPEISPPDFMLGLDGESPDTPSDLS